MHSNWCYPSQSGGDKSHSITLPPGYQVCPRLIIDYSFGMTQRREQATTNQLPSRGSSFLHHPRPGNWKLCCSNHEQTEHKPSHELGRQANKFKFYDIFPVVPFPPVVAAACSHVIINWTLLVCLFVCSHERTKQILKSSGQALVCTWQVVVCVVPTECRQANKHIRLDRGSSRVHVCPLDRRAIWDGCESF